MDREAGWKSVTNILLDIYAYWWYDMSRSKNPKYNHFVNKIREANSVSIEPEYITKQSRLSYACCHVHGEFFDAVFEVNPNAVIYSMGKKITKEYGNWEDTCINSFQGIFKSSMCEC